MQTPLIALLYEKSGNSNHAQLHYTPDLISKKFVRTSIFNRPPAKPIYKLIMLRFFGF
jgi:hypothetical protein